MKLRFMIPLALLCSHCAPNNAHELRELRPTTLGLLGGMYNGLTLLLDFGPGFRVAHSKSYAEAGANVDESKREDYREDVENKSVSFGGSGIIGYSF